MKFIPLESFGKINSLLQGVETHDTVLTIRLEAFTCRHTREEKQIASSLANYYAQVHTTPPLAPSPLLQSITPRSLPEAPSEGDQVVSSEDIAACPHPEPLPPPLVLGVSAASQSSGTPYSAPPVTADTIDERLVFFVAALNNLYSDEGYDFSVLSERDFICHDEATVHNEVELLLQRLPDRCAPAVGALWGTIEEQVLTAAQGCEYYEFICRSCDPCASIALFSHHYLLYNKRQKLLVCLLIVAEPLISNVASNSPWAADGDTASRIFES